MLVFLEILILLLVGMYNGEHKYFYLDKVFLQIFLFLQRKNSCRNYSSYEVQGVTEGHAPPPLSPLSWTEPQAET